MNWPVWVLKLLAAELVLSLHCSTWNIQEETLCCFSNQNIWDVFRLSFWFKKRPRTFENTKIQSQISSICLRNAPRNLRNILDNHRNLLKTSKDPSRLHKSRPVEIFLESRKQISRWSYTISGALRNIWSTNSCLQSQRNGLLLTCSSVLRWNRELETGNQQSGHHGNREFHLNCYKT